MTHHLLIAQFGNELLAIPSLRHIHGEEVALHRWGNMLEAINRWLDAWITWIRGEKFLMSRTFKTVDYDRALDLSVRLGDCLPPNHLARFVVDSVAQLDLSALYAHYGLRGGEPYAPEVLLGLLLYGYATGVFSSRKIERATYKAVPFRFIADNLHPDHDTLATFRRTFLPELKDLFVQVLLLAQEARPFHSGGKVLAC